MAPARRNALAARSMRRMAIFPAGVSSELRSYSFPATVKLAAANSLSAALSKVWARASSAAVRAATRCGLGVQGSACGLLQNLGGKDIVCAGDRLKEDVRYAAARTSGWRNSGCPC